MRIAFTNVGAHGHINPTLQVVRELVSRGAGVHYFSTATFRDPLLAAGAVFEPYDSLFEKHSMQRTAGGFDLGDLSLRLAEECAHVLPQLVPRLKWLAPDLVVYDALCHGGRLAARALSLRSARICPVLPSNKQWSVQRALGLPPPLSEPSQRGRALHAVRPALDAFGLSALPPSELFDFDAPCNVILLAKVFHPAAGSFDDSYHFVGPSIREAPAAAWANNGIFISLGTVFNDCPEFYETCFEAFGGTPHSVTLASTLSFSRVPENFRVRPSVPQLTVLAGARAFVTHGGINSLMEAAHYGVPVVVVPQMPEQRVNAMRAEALGIGVKLEPNEVSPRRLRQAVETVTVDPSYRLRSLKLGEAGRAAGGARAAADVLMAFLGA